MDSLSINDNDKDDSLLPPSSKIVLVVDPYSTGCCVVQEIMKRGYNVIVVWSKEITDEMKAHIPTSCSNNNTLKYYAEVTEDYEGNIEKTINEIKKVSDYKPIIACICGGEQGVTLCDILSEKMNLRTNGNFTNRRNKKLQQELCHDVGIRSVRQAGGSNINDVIEFLNKENYPIVVKPVESAGSDGVKLCYTKDEAIKHFHLLMNSQRQLPGSEGASVLCQEFLQGKEYIVDHVSKDGIHKTTMVWVYDKRPVNGAAFVYFGLIPVLSDSPEGKLIIPYVRNVLDALKIKNGASHGEVIINEKDNQPCLVEMNCRCNGGDGNWIPLVRALTGGYSQVDVNVDVYLEDDDKFNSLPDIPPSPFKASGQEVKLVSYSKGIVKSTPGYDVIKCLPSFVYLETRIDVGSKVDYTIDLFTDLGGVILMHEDENILKRDVDFIRYMEQINSFFTYETTTNFLGPPRSDAFVKQTTFDSDDGDSDMEEKKDGDNGDHYFPPLVKRPPMLSMMDDEGKTSAAAAGKKIPHTRGVFSSDGPMLIRHMSNDRPELMGNKMLKKRMTTIDASKEVVIICDPYSTGALVAKEIIDRGYKVIALWSKDLLLEMRNHVPLICDKLQYYDVLTESQNSMDDTIALVQRSASKGNYRIVACICGGEAGVSLCDELSEKLNLRTNGTDIPNKCDKKIQQEVIRDAGIRAVRQAGGNKFTDVEKFLREESYPVVVKPVESAGSDGVKLCHNFNEASSHFDLLMKSQLVNGGSCASVLCQEFLKGKEYIIDHVSRDGIHKTTMIWVYDKRPVNGAAFVYFGLLPVDSNSSVAKILIPYVRNVLNALGIKNGSSHGEVIMTSNGPCLVEMNCRSNGGDGNWVPLARALTGGYTQVDGCVDSYLDKKSFSIIPDKYPSPLKASGQEVKLVSYSRGIVKETPGFDIIKNLQSFVYFETGIKVGSKVDYTIDLITCIGGVILMHNDAKILENDVNTIRQLEKDNKMFIYEKPKVTQLMNSPSHINLHKLVGERGKQNSFIGESGKPPLSGGGGGGGNNKPSHRKVHSMSSDRSDLLW